MGRVLPPLTVLSLFLVVSREDTLYPGNPCYDENSNPQRCVPEFVNAAFNVKVEVTNTCGEHRPTEYCVQTGASGAKKSCDVCDSRRLQNKHSAEYLTDFNDKDNATWWQSGKAFDISYVRLKFLSPRPESFAIFKKTRDNSTWTPWQYYSGSCRSTYGVPDRAPILPGHETIAQCTSEYSDISPLTGADIAFSTRDGRPSAERFDSSDVLQDWVTATEMRVVLNRLNTFGDEVFGDAKVLRSYYYAISDLAVGGRCLCNGHASECVKSTGGGEERLVCRCEHNTEGADCEKCHPFYNDREWMRATADNANECKPCNCSNLSGRCYFDAKLFEETGSGGHCTDCQANTSGPHCELCVENHYRRPSDRGCTSCHCNEIGSMNMQCDDEGQCPCKPGVGGRQCDRCLPNFFDFSAQGCKSCGCVEAGSYGNQPSCRASTGECYCKANVEGKTCDRCKPGYFNLDLNNDFGCLSCFCYGHSSVCESAPGYYETPIKSDFTIGTEGWKTDALIPRITDAQHVSAEKSIIVSGQRGPAYFIAPAKFYGNQRNSYNRHLSFKLKVAEEGSRASVKDVVLEGDGQSVSAPIFGQQNPVPAPYEQEYKFRLHEDPQFQWNPRLSSLEFMRILSNLTAIKIRGSYTAGGVGYLDDVVLESASLTPLDATAVVAKHVETCQCTSEFTGQFCESCAPGFRREPKHGGSFARCIECQCHKHSELCDQESGKCLCQHNTDGDNCERCARGFYGNALAGIADDCKECPCPGRGPCVNHTDGDIICLECPPGYAGRRCEHCADGYFGKAEAEGERPECKLCECNGNIDVNAIGNCDSVNGECKKCVFNTHGFHCDLCLPGFWGDALKEPKGDCKACNCHKPGTVKPSRDYKVLECDQATGQCNCLPHVTGQKCDQCEPGYYNLTSGTGCQSCDCDLLGSTNGTCDVVTGQCFCKRGITGKHCDQCVPNHFGFGDKGCEACACLPIGSESQQCDLVSGQCPCKTNIEGRMCDRCEENMFNLQAGCLQCPPCYGLIQKRVNDHREKVNKLHDLLEDIKNNPTKVDDVDFDKKLADVQKLVEEVTDFVRRGMAINDTELANKIKDLEKKLTEASKTLEKVHQTVTAANATADATLKQLQKWNQIKDRARERLRQAQTYLDVDGKRAWEDAERASQTFGQQSKKLSEIASEARSLAEKHKAQVEKIESLAESARNTSQTAEKQAKAAISGTQAISRDITSLQEKFTDAQDRYNKTKLAAAEQKERAAAVFQEAAEALSKANSLSVPAEDTDEISDEATSIINDARNAKAEADRLSTENRPILEDAQRVKADAEYELSRCEQQQQVADRILAELDAAKDKANKAVELAEQTLQEANNTLHTLLEFDSLVERSRVEAEQALKDVDQIRQTISEAENRTTDAEQALGDAAEDARLAEEIAKQAKDVAQDASKAAMKVREDAGKTRESAQKLKTEATEFQGTLDDNNERSLRQTLTNYKQLAQEDKAGAQEVLQTARAAELAAQRSNKSADEALDIVKRILDDLNNLETVKEEDLNSLDSELASAQGALEEASLDAELEALREKQKTQQAKITSYKEQIDRLTKEVENIGQIRAALPNQCFNVVPIEEQRR